MNIMDTECPMDVTGFCPYGDCSTCPWSKYEPEPEPEPPETYDYWDYYFN